MILPVDFAAREMGGAHRLKLTADTADRVGAGTT